MVISKSNDWGPLNLKLGPPPCVWMPYFCHVTMSIKLAPKLSCNGKQKIHSWLSRCSTARGSSSGISLVGPSKVKACKFFLFTESSLLVKNNKSLRMRRSSVKLSGLVIINCYLQADTQWFTMPMRRSAVYVSSWCTGHMSDTLLE